MVSGKSSEQGSVFLMQSSWCQADHHWDHTLTHTQSTPAHNFFISSSHKIPLPSLRNLRWSLQHESTIFSDCQLLSKPTFLPINSHLLSLVFKQQAAKPGFNYHSWHQHGAVHLRWSSLPGFQRVETLASAACQGLPIHATWESNNLLRSASWQWLSDPVAGARIAGTSQQLPCL